MKVSIIIPCYNQGKYVADAINSALNQTYNDIQIVIVNDGSTDDSFEIIKQFADKYKNILFFDNKENNGVIYARNMAIERCDGDYILPLDSDDTIEPTYVEKAVKILNENPKIGIVYCRARFFGAKQKEFILSKFDKSNILYENQIFNCAMFRKKDFFKVGKYKESMKYGLEDYDLWLSFVENNFEAYRIDDFLFNYRQYKKYSRSDLAFKHQQELLKQLIKNHIDLYLNDKQFLPKLFTNVEILNRKIKKYRRLLPVVIIESVIILLLIVCLGVAK